MTLPGSSATVGTPGDTATCRMCGIAKPNSEFYQIRDRRFDRKYTDHRCKPCQKALASGDRRKHIEARLAYAHEYERTHRAERKAARLGLKAAAFAAYGGCCVCCGETELVFLAIDHVKGGGGAHRRAIGTIGTHFYRWLRQQGFPSGYQVLCHNCNWAKSHGGCPHEHARTKAGVA